MKQRKRRAPNRHNAFAHYIKSRRALEVADLYVAGKTQQQIAKALHISQTTVSDDLRMLKEQWREQAQATIAAWREQEIAYTTKMRLDAEVQWKRSNNPRVGDLVVKWSHRLDMLMGLEAPKKFEDWTQKNWQEYIKEHGLTESDARAAAEAILDEANRIANAELQRGAASSGSTVA